MKRKDPLPDNAGSKIQKMDNPDSLLLHSIAKRGSAAFDSAKEALELGADINAANKNGRSVIAVAAASGASLEVVKFLLERKADPHIADKEGHNALYYAALSSNTSYQVISLILSQMNKEDLNIDPASLITQVRSEKKLHLLLTNLKFTPESHNNFLHLALTKSAFPSVIAAKLIYNHGYSLDAKDSNGYTPWQSLLVKYSHEDPSSHHSLLAFEVLLKYPFNSRIEAPGGLNALNLLAMALKNCQSLLCNEGGGSNIASKLMKHFIECGAQVNYDTQENPIYHAIKNTDNSMFSITPLIKTFFALADNGVKIPKNILSLYINQYLGILQKDSVGQGYCDTHCRFIKDLAAKYSDQLDPAFFDEKTNSSALSTLRNIVELINFTYHFLEKYNPLQKQYIKSLMQQNNVTPSFLTPYEILKSIDSTPIKFDTVLNLLFNEKNLLSPLYKFWDGDVFIPPSSQYIAELPKMFGTCELSAGLVAEAKRLQEIKFQMNSLHRSTASQVTIEEIENKPAEEGATSIFAQLPLSSQQDTNEENLDVTMNGSDSNVLDSHL